MNANGVKHATHRSGSAQTLERNTKTTIASLTPDSVRAFTATANSCCHLLCSIPADTSHSKNSNWLVQEGVHEVLGHQTTDWILTFPMVLPYLVSNRVHQPNARMESSNNLSEDLYLRYSKVDRDFLLSSQMQPKPQESFVVQSRLASPGEDLVDNELIFPHLWGHWDHDLPLVLECEPA